MVASVRALPDTRTSRRKSQTAGRSSLRRSALVRRASGLRLVRVHRARTRAHGHTGTASESQSRRDSQTPSSTSTPTRSHRRPISNSLRLPRCSLFLFLFFSLFAVLSFFPRFSSFSRISSALFSSNPRRFFQFFAFVFFSVVFYIRYVCLFSLFHFSQFFTPPLLVLPDITIRFFFFFPLYFLSDDSKCSLFFFLFFSFLFPPPQPLSDTDEGITKRTSKIRIMRIFIVIIYVNLIFFIKFDRYIP